MVNKTPNLVAMGQAASPLVSTKCTQYMMAMTPKPRVGPAPAAASLPTLAIMESLAQIPTPVRQVNPDDKGPPSVKFATEDEFIMFSPNLNWEWPIFKKTPYDPVTQRTLVRRATKTRFILETKPGSNYIIPANSPDFDSFKPPRRNEWEGMSEIEYYSTPSELTLVSSACLLYTSPSPRDS